jgi:hypothetical protein
MNSVITTYPPVPLPPEKDDVVPFAAAPAPPDANPVALDPVAPDVAIEFIPVPPDPINEDPP